LLPITKQFISGDKMWKINFTTLKLAKDKGHCPCDLKKTCPCDEFLNEQKCRCGAYTKEEKQ